MQIGDNIIGVKDEHLPHSTTLRNNPTFLLDEESEVNKSDMHSLIDDLSDRHQFLGDHRDMQDVCHDSSYMHVEM